jgi:hypothetical protein
MHLLYCDETNFEKKPNNFFLYGGLIIDGNNAEAISRDIEALRKEFHIPEDFILKFSPPPKNLSHKQFIDLKKRVIKIAEKHDCKLLINLLLHDIATTSEEARRNSVNTLCFHFDCYLSRPKDVGLVIIDRFDDKQIDGQLKNRLSFGIAGNQPYINDRKLQRILGYHYAAIGQSHFCSLVDILIGSIRFSINAFTENSDQHIDSAKQILSQISPLFFREVGERVQLISLWFSPKDIKVDAYRKKYAQLIEFLMSNGIEPGQKFQTTDFD